MSTEGLSELQNKNYEFKFFWKNYKFKKKSLVAQPGYQTTNPGSPDDISSSPGNSLQYVLSRDNVKHGDVWDTCLHVGLF